MVISYFKILGGTMEIFKNLNEEHLDDFLKNFDFETLDLGDEDGNTYLHKLTQMKNIYGVEIFTDLGANINLRNKKGETPAHIAVEMDDSKIFEILLENGADLEIRNNSQRTPKQIASIKNRREIMQIINNSNGDYGRLEKFRAHRRLED